MEREGYGFSPEAKKLVHERAGNRCEFPGEPCPRPNNGEVHHITGVFEAKLSGMPREVVRNVELNAVMLCEPLHTEQHDNQEHFQVASLMAENWRNRGGTIYERKHNRSARLRRRKK
jgi:hypothetical protein